MTIDLRALRPARCLAWRAICSVAAGARPPAAPGAGRPAGPRRHARATSGNVWWFDAEQAQWVDAERNRPLTARRPPRDRGRRARRDAHRLDRCCGWPAGPRSKCCGSTTSALRGAAARRQRRVARCARATSPPDRRSSPPRPGCSRCAPATTASTATTTARRPAAWRGSLRIDDADGVVVRRRPAGRAVARGPVARTAGTSGRRCRPTVSPPGSPAEDQREARDRVAALCLARDDRRRGPGPQRPLGPASRVRRGLVPDACCAPTGRRTATATGPGCGPGAGPGSTTRPGVSRRSTTAAGSHVRGRWGWLPGDCVARPVYAPALVAWVGGPRRRACRSASAAPAVGWVPLAPREVYRARVPRDAGLLATASTGTTSGPDTTVSTGRASRRAPSATATATCPGARDRRSARRAAAAAAGEPGGRRCDRSAVRDARVGPRVDAAGTRRAATACRRARRARRARPARRGRDRARCARPSRGSDDGARAASAAPARRATLRRPRPADDRPTMGPSRAARDRGRAGAAGAARRRCPEIAAHVAADRRAVHAAVAARVLTPARADAPRPRRRGRAAPNRCRERNGPRSCAAAAAVAAQPADASARDDRAARDAIALPPRPAAESRTVETRQPRGGAARQREPSRREMAGPRRRPPRQRSRAARRRRQPAPAARTGSSPDRGTQPRRGARCARCRSGAGRVQGPQRQRPTPARAAAPPSLNASPEAARAIAATIVATRPASDPVRDSSSPEHALALSGFRRGHDVVARDSRDGPAGNPAATSAAARAPARRCPACVGCACSVGMDAVGLEQRFGVRRVGHAGQQEGHQRRAVAARDLARTALKKSSPYLRP